MSFAAMGVEDIHEVLTAMQKNLECPICLDLMKEPVSTRCDHIFCRFCMLQLLSKKKKGRAQCPLCKKEVTKRSLQESPRFKLLIDGLVKIINAFELDSGYKFFPSQDYAKSILPTYKESEEEEQTVVQSTGYRNRNRKRTVNGGQCEDFPTLLEVDTDTLLVSDVGTHRSCRAKRKKPETNNNKSKRKLMTEFESDSSEDDLFKNAESLGSDSDGFHLLNDQGEVVTEKIQDKVSKSCEANHCISLKPETEDMVASDLAEYGFSERDLESTQSNFICMDGVKASTETTSQKRASKTQTSLISDCDFAERELEQRPCSNLVSNIMHPEHNNQAASTMRLAKHIPDESQALKIAIDYQYDKDDSVPDEMASAQSSPGDVSCTVPRKRMKRSIQRVREWLLKTSDFLNATSWEEDIVSEGFPEVYQDGSDKSSSISDETEIVPAILPNAPLNTVEKPAATAEDKVFGKVYKREKKSNPVLKITCVADVHVDGGIHPPEVNGITKVPCLKRRRRTATALQPEDFIKRVLEGTEKNGNDDATLVVNHRLLDAESNEADKNVNIAETSAHENGLISISDKQDTKKTKKPLKKKSVRNQGTRTAQSLLLVRGSDLGKDKQETPCHSYNEIKIDSYPSSNEPGDDQRNVRRSRRLNLLPEKTLHYSPSQMATETKIKEIERDTGLKTTITTKQPDIAVESEDNETQIIITTPTEAPNLTDAKVQPEHSVCVTDTHLKGNSQTQADDGRNVFSAEEIEDSDIDTQHLLKTFKSAKRMSFKLDPAELSNKENCNPMHLSDVNTNMSNGHQNGVELALNDQETLSTKIVVHPVAPNLGKSVAIGEAMQGNAQILNKKLPKSSTKRCLRSKKKHDFNSDSPVKGAGESKEKSILHENESLPGAVLLNDLSLVNETEPHKEGNQGRNAAVSRSEELVLLSETESLSLHRVVTHQSPIAVRRGDTRSGTGQGENEQAKDYCYQKYSFDEEGVNQITSLNGPEFLEMKKLQGHLVSCEGSPIKSLEVLSDTPDGLCIADKSRVDGSLCREANKSFVFGNEKTIQTCRPMSPINTSQFISRKKRKPQKLESSEEESSEDEELPCFNDFLFGDASCSAGHKNTSTSSSPKQQGGGVLAMFSSNSTSGKTQASLHLPKGAFTSSQESVNLFSSQSNTSEHSAKGNTHQENISKLPESPEKCSKRETEEEEQIECYDNEMTNDEHELGEQHLDEISGCESETSHAGDSSGLSSQCEILNTQQRDAMQNNLEKLQREMAALEAVLKQHGTRSPSSQEEQASIAEHATENPQEACQEQTDHGTNISPDAIPNTEQSPERPRSPTPPPSPSQTKAKKKTPEKVRASLNLLKELKENILTQKECNDVIEPPAPIVIQTTASQSHGPANGLFTRKGRSSLLMESTEAEQQPRQSSNGSVKRSSSPTFTSPTRSRTSFGTGKSPIIPNRRNFSLVASGLSQSELMVVQKFARKTQSLLSSQMTESTTHVIMKTDEHLVCERTLKYFLGIAARKWVLSYDWIVQSFREGRILDEYDFEVRGDVINGRNHKGPRRARLGLDGLLLSDFEICCLGAFKDMTRENLEWMVSLCGASVVKEPQLFKHKEGTTSLVVLQSDGKTDYEAMRKKYRALIVAREWVLDSVASYKLQSFDGYLL